MTPSFAPALVLEGGEEEGEFLGGCEALRWLSLTNESSSSAPMSNGEGVEGDDEEEVEEEEEEGEEEVCFLEWCPEDGASKKTSGACRS